MRFGRHFTRVWGVRQHGNGDGRHRQHLIFSVGDSRNHQSRWRVCQQKPVLPGQQAGEREIFDEIEAKLIFPTTAVD
jgi:hypothetical protein